MKQLLLILTLLTTSLVAQDKGEIPKYYQNVYTGGIISPEDFEEFYKELRQSVIDTTNEEVAIKIMPTLQTINKEDSIIYPFTYRIRVGVEYIYGDGMYEKIGMPIIPTTFTTIDDEAITIGGPQSKPTFLNLWFTSCGGCVQEIPHLNELEELYGDKVNFVAMTFDKETEVKDFLMKKHFSFKHVTDEKRGRFIKQVATMPYPENIIIDCEGTIRQIESVIGEDDMNYLKALLVQLIEESQVDYTKVFPGSDFQLLEW